MSSTMSAGEIAVIQRLRFVDGLSQSEIAARMGRARGSVTRALSMYPGYVPPRRCTPSPEVPNRVRLELVALRLALRDGELSLADVLLPVHPLVAELALVDVVMMQRSGTRRRNAASMEQLGAEAVRDGVNLLRRAGRSSEASRRWVVEHGSKWVLRRRVAA